MRSAQSAALLTATLLLSGVAHAQQLRQVNLVSDVAGQALRVDPNLVNPWGIVPGASGVFWVSNNGTGTSTLYDPDGTPRPLVVTIPDGENTGVVAPAASDSAFRIPSADTTARAVFIFVTEGGNIAAWSPLVDPTHAITVASNGDAVYKGVALGGSQSAPRLFVADFAGGTIDVFDRDFARVATPGSFTDPTLPDSFAPFNVANLGGQIFVSYAQRNPATNDDVAGPGLGFVSVFDQDGNFLRRFASQGVLDAPWAMVRAVPGFGSLGGALLVGNFGDGRINAFDFASGSFIATLQDTMGNPLMIDGLWGLHFGLPVSGAAVAQRLYFAAGLDDEHHGLFGYLSAFGGAGGPPPPPPPPVCVNDSKGIGQWRKLCGGPKHPGDDGQDHGHGGGGGGGGNGGGGNGGGGDGDGDDGGHGHGHGPGVPSDSLDALFACISSAGAPNAFGSGGCFTADCALLQKVGRRSTAERAAQELLTLDLNLCSGLVCSDLRLHCEGATPGMTVGDLVDSLDVALCTGARTSRLHALTALAACVNGGGEEDEEAGDDDGRVLQHKLDVHTIGASPVHLGSAAMVQFSVTATEPALVRIRVYDALGRLVAEPLRGSFVIGTTSARWDGRNQNGALVTPGNYFFRATSANGTASGKIVVIR